MLGDIAGLAEGEGRLSLVTNEQGGIIDDTVITNAGDYIYMVVNGATKFGDMKHFQEQMELFQGDVTMEYLEDSKQLLALQGPGAAHAVAKILPAGFDLVKMPFMTGVDTTLDGVEGCRITRYGSIDEQRSFFFSQCLTSYSVRYFIVVVLVVDTRERTALKLPCPKKPQSR